MLRWFAIVLLALTVCLQAVGSVSVSWMCEGRVCSTDPLYCCCNAPGGHHRDSVCASSKSRPGYECRCKCRANVAQNKNAFDSDLTKVAFNTSSFAIAAPALATLAAVRPIERTPEAPLLSRPPPGRWQDAELDRAYLRGPPSLID